MGMEGWEDGVGMGMDMRCILEHLLCGHDLVLPYPTLSYLVIPSTALRAPLTIITHGAYDLVNNCLHTMLRHL